MARQFCRQYHIPAGTLCAQEIHQALQCTWLEDLMQWIVAPCAYAAAVVVHPVELFRLALWCVGSSHVHAKAMHFLLAARVLHTDLETILESCIFLLSNALGNAREGWSFKAG